MSTWFVVLLSLGAFIAILLWFVWRGHKLKQPVVIFTARFWSVELVLTLLMANIQLAGLGFVILSGVASGLFTNPETALIGVGVCLFILLTCGPTVTYLLLYWSYWQHDRAKGLTFYKAKARLRHWYGDEYTDYAISDVTTRTQHDTSTPRLSFSYTVFTLSNGTTFLVTYLLCDAYDLSVLLPHAKVVFIKTWFPWLPKAESSQ